MFVLVYMGRILIGSKISNPPLNLITIGFIKIKPIQPNDTIQTTKF